MIKWCSALGLAVLVSSGALAQDDCRLQIAASLPIMLDGANRNTVPATIEGKDVRLLVDTGATATLMRESLADELKLNYEIAKRWERHRIFGGINVNKFVNVKDFRLGKLQASGIPFMLVPQEERVLKGEDGILGGNVLTQYDVDFDFANAKMNMFLPHRCSGQAVYWTQDESAIAKVPFIYDNHIRVEVLVDGKKIKATLDTGASTTVLDTEEFMPQFGLTPSSPGMTTTSPPGAENPRYSYTFKTLSFGGVTVQNPKVTFVSSKTSKVHDYNMLIGMDVLRNLHLYVAYKEKMLFITSATQH